MFNSTYIIVNSQVVNRVSQIGFMYSELNRSRVNISKQIKSTYIFIHYIHFYPLLLALLINELHLCTVTQFANEINENLRLKDNTKEHLMQ